MKATLCIVTKAPDPTRSKTRLISLTPQGRVAIAGAMLEDVLELATSLSEVRVVLACDPSVDHPYFEGLARRWPIERQPQGDGDLGQRLIRLSAALLQGPSPLIFLGGDCPHLPPETLSTALEALRTHDVALAEAEDGGYVLIGLRAPSPHLFLNMPWSTERVAQATRQAARIAGQSVAELPRCWDVDRPEDLARLARLPSPSAATRTKKLVQNPLLYTDRATGLG